MNDAPEETKIPEEEASLEQAIDNATDAVAVTSSELKEIGDADSHGDNVGIDSLLDVPVQVTVHVGRAHVTLGELVKLTPGSLLELDRETHEPADILVNGKIVARGEIVTIDDTYGVRVTSVNA